MHHRDQNSRVRVTPRQSLAIDYLAGSMHGNGDEGDFTAVKMNEYIYCH